MTLLSIKALLIGTGSLLMNAAFVLQTSADLLVSCRSISSSNTILRYDEQTGAFLGIFATIDPRTSLYSITFGPDDNLYVINATSDDITDGPIDQVLRYDGGSGGFLDVFAPTGRLRGPINLVFGPDGNLYVSVISFTGGNHVLRFDGKTGEFINVFASLDPLFWPRGLAFGPDNNLYVANGMNPGNVLRYDGVNGELIDEFIPGGSGGLARAIDLEFGVDGKLYVLGGPFIAPGVFRYDGHNGAFVDRFVSVQDEGYPTDMKFGPDGNLYIATSGDNFGVLRYDGTTGSHIGGFVTLGSGGLLAPFGIAFSPRPIDQDGDGIVDQDDQCPNTPTGAVVDSGGCSVHQLVPCEGPLSGGQWKNRGQYVSALARVLDKFHTAGFLDHLERELLINEAAASNCGRR